MKRANLGQIGIVAAAFLILMGGTALAAPPAGVGGGGPPDGVGGGGPPDGVGEDESGNNLSYPAVDTTGSDGPLEWTAFSADTAGLGVYYSFGCGIPEEEFPNTSCINTDGTFMSKEACQTTLCAGSDVDPIYWQKAGNSWWAETIGDNTGPVPAAAVDWGDNLESQTWTASSVIRVETTPFASTDTYTDRDSVQGFQMWHVSGKGTDELWGVHVDDSLAPYVYTTLYPIIYTPNAKLNLAKLEEGATACTAAKPDVDHVSWNATTTSWDGAFFNETVPYTAELNIGGKYVYGYNWMLRRLIMTDPTVQKAGWWRLTFYSDVVDFVDGIPTAPPVALTDPSPITILAEEGDDSNDAPKYVPVVNGEKDITFIDICIAAERGGGSGTGGGGGNGPPTTRNGPPTTRGNSGR